MIKIKLAFVFLLIYSTSLSQTSNLGRFSINLKQGCIPLEVEIISENLDSSVTVVQYDFDYNLTNSLFNPSGSKSNIYSDAGKFIIAQAINQDGVEKIDIIEIEAFEKKDLNVDIINCSSNSLEINIDDNYYDSYKLFIRGNFHEYISNGTNILDYSGLLDSNNSVEGYIIGVFDDNEKNCSKYNFKVVPVNNNITNIIDSVALSDDKTKFDLIYNPEKSTYYEILIDNNLDSIYFTPSFLYFNHSTLDFLNKSFNQRCIKIIKKYGCGEPEIEDEICLIYLNAFENDNGINIEFNSNDKYDSIAIYRDDVIIHTTYQDENKLTDNNGIIKNKEYCYQVVGYKSNKKSLSNKFCLISNNNYNPIPIPNAFSPNNDGLNDVFKPFYSNVSGYKMYIFNKFGEKVFESNDINIGWDGYFKGKIIQDSYVYKIEFNKDNEQVYINGKFLLIK